MIFAGYVINHVINEMKSVLGCLPQNVPCIIMGDFNIDLVESPHQSFVKMMHENGFKQLVNTPTTDNGTLLDHVYVHSTKQVDIQVVDCYYSDHDTILIYI